MVDQSNIPGNVHWEYELVTMSHPLHHCRLPAVFRLRAISPSSPLRLPFISQSSPFSSSSSLRVGLCLRELTLLRGTAQSPPRPPVRSRDCGIYCVAVGAGCSASRGHHSRLFGMSSYAAWSTGASGGGAIKGNCSPSEITVF